MEVGLQFALPVRRSYRQLSQSSRGQLLQSSLAGIGQQFRAQTQGERGLRVWLETVSPSNSLVLNPVKIFHNQLGQMRTPHLLIILLALLQLTATQNCLKFEAGRCIECPPGTHLFRSNCLFDVANCFEYVNGFDCAACVPGFSLDSAGLCVEDLLVSDGIATANVSANASGLINMTQEDGNDTEVAAEYDNQETVVASIKQKNKGLLELNSEQLNSTKFKSIEKAARQIPYLKTTVFISAFDYRLQLVELYSFYFWEPTLGIVYELLAVWNDRTETTQFESIAEIRI